MQCRRAAWRNVCDARNAYNPTVALRAALSSQNYHRNATKPSPIADWVLDSSSERPTSRTLKAANRGKNGRSREDLDQQAPASRNGQPRRHKPEEQVKEEPPITKKLWRAITISESPLQLPRFTNGRTKKHGGISTGTTVDNPPRTESPIPIEELKKPIGDQAQWKKHMLLVRQTAAQLVHIIVKSLPLKKEALDKKKTVLDYEGRYIRVPESPLQQLLPTPWLVEGELKRLRGESHAVLENEIQRFVAFMEPTSAEAAARRAVIAELQAFIAQEAQDERFRTEVYGSEKTGLKLPVSDIDLRIFDTNSPSSTDPKAKPEMVALMHTLHDALDKSDQFICTLFRHRAYPIISCQHRSSGIDIQIVAAPDSKPQQDVAAEYLASMPHLRSLYVVVRTTLGIRGLIDVFSGGLGSYGTLIMVAASMKRRDASSLPPSPTYPLAAYFLHFLDFFTTLDTTRYGVTLRSPRTLFKKRDYTDANIPSYIRAATARGDLVRAGQYTVGRRRDFQPYLLSLQDPARPTNNLGLKSNAIRHITCTLTHIRQRLREVMAAIDDPDDPSRTFPPQFSVLQSSVGRCHEVYYERRRKLEIYGRETLFRESVGGIEAKEEEKVEQPATTQSLS